MSAQDPIGLMVRNICRLNNGAMQQIGAYLATQPTIVRAQFIGRCAAMVESAASSDAVGFEHYGEAAFRPVPIGGDV